MTKPKTRWDICEQCVSERFLRGKANGASGLFTKEVLTYIEENKRRNWRNPYRGLVNDGPAARRCHDCPFAMEHIVLGTG